MIDCWLRESIPSTMARISASLPQLACTKWARSSNDVTSKAAQKMFSARSLKL